MSSPLPTDTMFEVLTVLEIIGMMSLFLAVNGKFLSKTWEENFLKINSKEYCNFIFSDKGKAPDILVYVVLHRSSS